MSCFLKLGNFGDPLLEHTGFNIHAMRFLKTEIIELFQLSIYMKTKDWIQMITQTYLKVSVKLLSARCVSGKRRKALFEDACDEALSMASYLFIPLSVLSDQMSALDSLDPGWLVVL